MMTMLLLVDITITTCCLDSDIDSGIALPDFLDPSRVEEHSQKIDSSASYQHQSIERNESFP